MLRSTYCVLAVTLVLGCAGDDPAEPVVPVETVKYANVVVKFGEDVVMEAESTEVMASAPIPVSVELRPVPPQTVPWHVRLRLATPDSEGDAIVGSASLELQSEGDVCTFSGEMQIADVEGDLELTVYAHDSESSEKYLIFRAP